MKKLTRYMPSAKRYSPNWKLLCVLLTLLIGSFAFTSTPLAQTLPETAVVIPLGSTVRATWIAPPDTDVVRYNLYLTGTSYERTVGITTWFTANTNPDSCTYQLDISIPLGPGVADLTAVDRSGNESAHSAKVYYMVTDPAPGPPTMFEFKLVR